MQTPVAILETTFPSYYLEVSEEMLNFAPKPNNMNMRTKRMMLAVMLTAACCTQIAAQGLPRSTGNSPTEIKIDYLVPVTNINLMNGPKLFSDNKVEFTVRAPEAQKVQVDIGGTKYDMTKGDGGTWTVKTKPQVPGFHYYSLIIDGVSVADPASQSFYGCSRWSSAIEIPEKGMDDFEVQNVKHGEVHTVHYFSNVERAWRPLMVYTPAGYDEGKKDYPVVYIQHGGGEDHRG